MTERTLKTELRILVPIDVATWLIDEKNKNNTTISQIVLKGVRKVMEESE